MKSYAGWATDAVCSEVLEHVDSPVLFLQAARPWLADGSRLIVTVPGGSDFVGLRPPHRPSAPFHPGVDQCGAQGRGLHGEAGLSGGPAFPSSISTARWSSPAAKNSRPTIDSTQRGLLWAARECDDGRVSGPISLQSAQLPVWLAGRGGREEDAFGRRPDPAATNPPGRREIGQSAARGGDCHRGKIPVG